MVIAAAFDASNRVINYLNNLGLNFSKGAIVFYDSHKIQFRYHIKRSPQISLIGSFGQELRSKTMTSLELGPVLSVYCFTLPNNEDLTNVLISEGHQTLINIPYLIQNTKAEDIIIQFEKDLSMQDLEILIPVANGLRNPIYHEDDNRKMLEIPIEMAVDYAELWFKQYESFYVREIKRNYTIGIHDWHFSQLLPDKLRIWLKKIADDLRLESKDIKSLKQVSDTFRKFQSGQEIELQLSKIASTDRPKNISFLGLHREIEEVRIHGRELVVPHRLGIDIFFEMEGKSLSISGRIFLNLKILDNIIRSLGREAEKYI